MKRLTDLDKQKIKELYNLGKNDSQISKELNIKIATICYYRKHNNLPTKFTYESLSKINFNEFKILFDQGLSDYKIAKQLNVSASTIYFYRKKYNFIREDLRYNKSIKLTYFQKQVLLGTLLGDSSLRLTKDCKNAKFICSHSIKQKEYCEYKAEIFKNLGVSCKYHKRNVPDKRNGIYYEDYTLNISSNPEFNIWYQSLYKNKIKVIPFNLFKYFTEISLAFMFMDDGSKIGDTFTIATNCFTEEELTKFRIFLLQKFELETTMFKSHVIYIKKKSASKFISLIKPYIIPCMQYKIQSRNHVNLGKSGDR